MDQTGQDFLKLMFRPEESVCISHNKFGYYSIPLENILKNQVILVPTPESCEKRKIEWNENAWEKPDNTELLLVALNPISGFRNDTNCTAFRNFLIEIDHGTSEAQLEYIKSFKMPYSAVVFSGNKSLHFLISLDKDLPNEEIWRYMAEWILNIVTMADQQTKNPSRSIRIPGAEREPGKFQKLVEMNSPISLEVFTNWLNQYPFAKPKKKEKRTISEIPDFNNIKEYIRQMLVQGTVGVKKGRNVGWFTIAVEFALAGYSEDDAMDLLSQYFSPERDFKEKEWKASIKSGFKYAYSRK